MRPLLRWAGSKKQLLPKLRRFWERSTGRRYVEPFAGSAALFFDAEPTSALLSDTNRDLVSFYRCMQTCPELVYELATSWSVDSETYYSIRAEFREEKDRVRRSAMFFYLNRFCFNGIFRTNLAGQFNVPFSGLKTGSFPSWEEVTIKSSLLNAASFECLDFESLIKRRIRKGDFVYLDPPYAVENRRVFVQYSANNFGASDLQRLSDLLHCIDALGAKFVLSYAFAPESLHFFSAWKSCRTHCQRNVAGFADHRRRAVELLVSNIDIEKDARNGDANE